MGVSEHYVTEFGSIPGMVRHVAHRHESDVALIDGERQWTFGELDDELIRSVRAAIAWGVRPGDRIGLIGSNSATWIFAALGVLGAGGILVPLNTRWRGDELAFALNHSGAQGLIVEQGLPRQRLSRHDRIRWAVDAGARIGGR